MDLLLDEVGRGQVGLPAGKLVVDRLYLRVADLHTSHTPHATPTTPRRLSTQTIGVECSLPSGCGSLQFDPGGTLRGMDRGYWLCFQLVGQMLRFLCMAAVWNGHGGGCATQRAIKHAPAGPTRQSRISPCPAAAAVCRRPAQPASPPMKGGLGRSLPPTVRPTPHRPRCTRRARRGWPAARRSPGAAVAVSGERWPSQPRRCAWVFTWVCRACRGREGGR